MSNRRLLFSLVVAAALVGSRALLAQDAAAAPAPAAPRVDSAAMWAGDWDFQIQLRDSTIGGGWRLNYVQGRFTGIVARPGLAPSPIRAFTLRGTRDMTLTVDWNGELYTFSGHLDTPRTITGTVSAHGGIGRLRASKRG